MGAWAARALCPRLLRGNLTEEKSLYRGWRGEKGAGDPTAREENEQPQVRAPDRVDPERPPGHPECPQPRPPAPVAVSSARGRSRVPAALHLRGRRPGTRLPPRKAGLAFEVRGKGKQETPGQPPLPIPLPISLSTFVKTGRSDPSSGKLAAAERVAAAGGLEAGPGRLRPDPGAQSCAPCSAADPGSYSKAEH